MTQDEANRALERIGRGLALIFIALAIMGVAFDHPKGAAVLLVVLLFCLT